MSDEREAARAALLARRAREGEAPAAGFVDRTYSVAIRINGLYFAPGDDFVEVAWSEVSEETIAALQAETQRALTKVLGTWTPDPDYCEWLARSFLDDVER